MTDHRAISLALLGWPWVFFSILGYAGNDDSNLCAMSGG